MKTQYVLMSILLSSLLLIFGCATQQESIIPETRGTQDIMGTIVQITIYDNDTTKANKAMEEAFEEMKLIDSMLSIYQNESEISKLNDEKILSLPSGDLLLNIAYSSYYGNLTNGSFDITVQPILDLYKDSFSVNGRAPTDDEIEQELMKVDYKRIEFNTTAITLGHDQRITLGGIAKGYAVDRAIDILYGFNISHALVNAGGDLRAIGMKDNNTPWNIGLANPRDKMEYVALIKLSNRSVVTSGDYERYFNENKTFHHIIDPKTGYSATELMSVTIIADNALDADAIATSVFVMGKEKGLALIESLEDVECLIITRGKEIIRSSGFDAASS